MQDFHDTPIWQRSRSFLSEIFLISNKFPGGPYERLLEQLRRSSIAIPANIARAFSQPDSSDSNEFFNLSGSFIRNVSQYLLKAKNHQLIDNHEFELINNDLIDINRMLASIQHHNMQ